MSDGSASQQLMTHCGSFSLKMQNYRQIHIMLCQKNGAVDPHLIPAELFQLLERREERRGRQRERERERDVEVARERWSRGQEQDGRMER